MQKLLMVLTLLCFSLGGAQSSQSREWKVEFGPEQSGVGYSRRGFTAKSLDLNGGDSWGSVASLMA